MVPVLADFYILSISANTTACWSALSFDQRSSNFRWDSVRETGASPSAKKWDKVIPNAAQIFSKEGMVCTMFFRYQDEMVDWGKPERSASWYSVQQKLGTSIAASLGKESKNQVIPSLKTK